MMPMAARAHFAPVKKNRQQRATGPRKKTPIATTRPRVGTRTIARSQNKPSVPNGQASTIRSATIPQPARAKRKRPQEDLEAEDTESEGVRLSKEPRILPPSKDQLSEQNLRIFNGEDMDPPANSARPPSIKRSLSRRSTTGASDLTQDTARSQSSSNTTAFYRYNHLAAAEVYIHTDPPDDIRATINSIVKADVPVDRRARLHDIAKELCDGCKKTVQAAAGEDDFVDLFLTALKAMGPDRLFFRAKADWREELKPRIQQSDVNLSFLADFSGMGSDQQQEADDASAPPAPKRQQQSASQTEASNPMPDNRPLQSDMMPPPAPRPAKESSPIKTPRPDISMGIQGTDLVAALSSALASQNPNHTRAKQFLKKLEATMMPSERGGPAEPALMAMPTQRASGLVFPFAVVEGKAYSTGKQVFEAQNQAAVAGASALKMQLSLNELVKRSMTTNTTTTTTTSSDLSTSHAPPLFFSICTEGPHHELWAHYSDVKDEVRQFHMTLLKTCHGVLLDGVQDFLVALHNVLRWGTGPFVDSVVERLGKVARKAGA